jgi:uncharacterized membrane protein
MHALIQPFVPSTGGRAVARLRHVAAELLGRERRLTLYGAGLLALLVPMALAWGLDYRMLTTAWFVGHLPRELRSGRAIDRIVWLLIGAGSFELAYITLQAALGQGSHYNVGDAWHGTMYTLMGIGALLLTATQPMLAWQLARHPDRSRPTAYRQAVLIGLLLTFVFGAGVGGVLGGLQPPTGGAVVPFFGWSLGGGDLRPAHFIGIHAEQVLPAIGSVAASSNLRHPKAAVWAAALGYSLIFAVLVGWGLVGRV